MGRGKQGEKREREEDGGEEARRRREEERKRGRREGRATLGSFVDYLIGLTDRQTDRYLDALLLLFAEFLDRGRERDRDRGVGCWVLRLR